MRCRIPGADNLTRVAVKARARATLIAEIDMDDEDFNELDQLDIDEMLADEERHDAALLNLALQSLALVGDIE